MKYNINTNTPVSELARSQDAKRYIGSNQNTAREAFVAKAEYARIIGSNTNFYDDLFDVLQPLPKTFTDDVGNDINIPSFSSLFEPNADLVGIYRIINNTRLPMLGTVNRSLIPLQPKQQYFSYYEDNKRSHFALDFVINSFINLKTAYARGIFEGKGISNSEFLSSLSLYKAGVNINQPLSQHLQAISDDFIVFCLNDIKNRRKVITPQNFFNYFSNYLIFASKSKAITFSTKILANNIDFNFNGISLDIAEIPYDVDAEKVKRIYQDPNYQLYASAVQEFGFVISQEYPFKLIANLNSTRMRDSICACGKTYLNGQQFNTAEEIISFYFEPVYTNDLSILYNLYDIAYERFIKRFKVEYDITYKDSTINKTKYFRETNEFDLIDPLLNDDFLISLYITLKNNEIGLKFASATLRSFIITAKQINANHGLDMALKYINEKFRITYELITLEKKGFKNMESFTYEEALALIRLTRYDY
jgi:hypothetical protein